MHNLSEDITKIKDTVAEVARIVGSQIEEPSMRRASEIAWATKKNVLTMVIALVGAILLLLGLIFGVEALHEWLKSLRHPARLVVLCGAWTLVGIMFLCLALLLSKWEQAIDPKIEFDPAAEVGAVLINTLCWAG